MDLKLDTKGIDVLARGFKQADKARPKEVARAINSAQRRARTLSNRAVREDLNLPLKYVNERIDDSKKATYTNLNARLTVKGRPILWGRFKHKATRKGVKAKVDKGKAWRDGPGGFVVPLKAGDKTIMAPAYRTGGRYPGTGTLKFKPYYGPSVPGVLRDKLKGVEAEVSEYLQAELDKRVTRLMERI